MFKIAINPDKLSLERLKQKPAEMRAALFPAMEQCMRIAESTAKRQYLSGPRPLRLDRRTGRLRGSIAVSVEDAAGSGVRGKIGTNVVYARAHEKGFRGAVSVRAHTRKVKSRNVYGAERRVSKSGKAYAKKVVAATGLAFVKGHTRRMNLPARPFLRPAIEDNFNRFRDIFRKSLIKAFG